MTNQERYEAALHGVQSAIAYEMSIGLSRDTEPKHLRVGINSATVEHSALAEMLISKGVISREEYVAALADGMERELALYEQRHPGISFR